MFDQSKTSTINLLVRNETFELPFSLFNKLVAYSSSSQFISSQSDNQNSIYIDVNPRIFNSYLIYIQSGCFIRPDLICQKDLINDLRQCGAPIELINHYKYSDFPSSLSIHQYSSDSIKHKWLNSLILFGLFVSTCILSIDFYRQILILNKNPYQEQSKLLIVLIYLIDGILFIYGCFDGISKLFLTSFEKNVDLIVDIISCIGIFCYFIIQRPITNICISEWNFVWILIHLCRTIRLIEIGLRLIDIQWCFYAIIQSISIFFESLIGLFWIFIFCGSILYLIDIIEDNKQYLTIFSTILCVHETLYTIGYRNNAPYGCLTRLWIIIIIYFVSSIVQILLWWFQTKVTIQWKILLDQQKEFNHFK